MPGAGACGARPPVSGRSDPCNSLGPRLFHLKVVRAGPASPFAPFLLPSNDKAFTRRRRSACPVSVAAPPAFSPSFPGPPPRKHRRQTTDDDRRQQTTADDSNLDPADALRCLLWSPTSSSLPSSDRPAASHPALPPTSPRDCNAREPSRSGPLPPSRARLQRGRRLAGVRAGMRPRALLTSP